MAPGLLPLALSFGFSNPGRVGPPGRADARLSFWTPGEPRAEGQEGAFIQVTAAETAGKQGGGSLRDSLRTRGASLPPAPSVPKDEKSSGAAG